MREYLKFYVDGQWVDPLEMSIVETINPATEEVSGKIALGTAADVDRAVKAARKAFTTWSETSKEERLEVLQRILAEYEKRSGDLGQAITDEMGAPKGLAQGFHVALGNGHLSTAIEVLKSFEFEELRGNTMIRHEPIGVVSMITPWNWPVNQIAVKVFPAIAAGCTVVLKPSQESHFSAQILAEIIDAADVPAGVFNFIQGKGSVVGAEMSSHPEVDMVSITGSEAAGIQVAKNAADTVKRVCQELGGKSANIILDDDNLPNAVAGAIGAMMMNSGQTCSATSRMLVPMSRMDEAMKIAKEAPSLWPFLAGWRFFLYNNGQVSVTDSYFINHDILTNNNCACSLVHNDFGFGIWKNLERFNDREKLNTFPLPGKGNNKVYRCRINSCRVLPTQIHIDGLRNTSCCCQIRILQSESIHLAVCKLRFHISFHNSSIGQSRNCWMPILINQKRTLSHRIDLFVCRS